MRTLRRLKFMSSPSLSDLGKREPAAAAAADERGTQQRRACANATWNSIHNGVIAVFQRKGLPDQELFSLNEGVRQLLKTELGSFFTEYLQIRVGPQSPRSSSTSPGPCHPEPWRPRHRGHRFPGAAEATGLQRQGTHWTPGPLRSHRQEGRGGAGRGLLLQAQVLSPTAPRRGENQLLTKGMVILRDKIRFYEGQKLLDSLAETWDFFFSDVLPTLQAVFYPVQGKEPSVRQLALLHFRNTITLGVKLEDALARAHARVPPAIVQMLLVLQGVHESRGVTKDYLRLETLIQKVVSPYLGTYGLYSGEGAFTHSCILEKHYLRRSRSGDVLAKNPVVRSKSYNTPLLNPVAEHEAEGAAAGGAGIRRHSVSEMTSCPEPQGFADTPGPGPAGAFGTSPSSPPSGPCPSRLYPPAQPPKPGPGAARGSPASSSPENLVDQILESVDSDSEGIFIDFGRGGGSGTSEFEGAGGRQSVV